MLLTVHYGSTAGVSSLQLNGEEVLDTSGIFSLIKTNDREYSSGKLISKPVCQVSGNTITISNIVFGDSKIRFSESWVFDVLADDVRFQINRTTPKPLAGAVVASPVIRFKNINTWEGAYQDYGGLAWFYLFNKPLDTYGVHSSASEFWNSKTGNGLRISVQSAGNNIAMSYSRTSDDKLDYRIAFANEELTQRYDTPTFRRRFIRDGTNVWAGSTLKAGTTKQTISFSWFDFEAKFGRGEFKGIDGKQVSDVLNTIARIGVIDKQHFGGNSWHTPYGPICLHEQYIGQMGVGINDPNYLSGYQDCLDFYRDHAIKTDGRVWSRWAYTNEDMMPGQVNKDGFYEAQWGFLIDANPDLVINVAELYDQTGNKTWLKTHKLSCEKALDWLLKRDFNRNGLVEMLNDNQSEQKSSDWIDIIWASYENAFVNVKLYRALILWAEAEKQLGDQAKSKRYADLALKLKTQFNKPTSEGGLWDEEKQCYVHWRDKDGTIHGRNMVTPVNFMAISYGICDDQKRKQTILDNIETQMVREKLFFWPLCMSTYAPGEGKDWQFPFPNYENGDIFLSWGSVAVDAYASYKPELALKYVRNVLAQYAKDGLAYQRYGRNRQEGLGDDILSGNCLSIVGLYRSIYGINPRYNRLYLDPHITSELAGTKLNYNFRGQRWQIELSEDRYTISDKRFSISAGSNFGIAVNGDELSYFAGAGNDVTLKVHGGAIKKLSLEFKKATAGNLQWIQTGSSGSRLRYQLAGFDPLSFREVKIGDSPGKKLRSNTAGVIEFEVIVSNEPVTVTVQ